MEPTGETFPENEPDLTNRRESKSVEPAHRDLDELVSAANRSAFRIHSPRAVAFASLFGGPLAGCTLLAFNYFKLSRPFAAVQTILLGLVATALEVLLLVVLPEQFTYSVPPISHLAMVFLAKSLQGGEYKRHLQDGGETAPLWIASAIGFLASMVIISGLAAWNVFEENEESPAPHLTFGPDEEVIYDNGAAEAEARKIGQFLQANGFFNGVGGKSVRVMRPENVLVVEFVLQQRALDDPLFVKDFKVVQARLSREVFDGRPVEVHLVNNRWEVQHTLK